MIALLKVVLVPLSIGIVSLAGKRWGPTVAGSWAGMPVVLGPILLLLWLEHGAAFGRVAAVHSLSAVFPVVSFTVAYARLSHRLTWPGTLLSAYGIWLMSTALTLAAPMTLALAGALAVASVLAGHLLLPHPSAAPPPTKLPRVELLLRMSAGAALTLLVTSLAGSAGTRLSGTFALFPILTTVLAVFTHRSGGSEAVISLLRGLATGLYSLIAFCVVLILLPTDNSAVAFVLSSAVAVIVQTVARAK
jgi:uncharacterized membrane protein (GlpM family)